MIFPTLQCDSVGGPLRLPLSVGMVKEEYEPSDIVSMQTHKCDQCNDEAPPAKTLMAHVLPLLLNLVASSSLFFFFFNTPVILVILVIMRCRLTFLPNPSRGAQC